MLMLDICNVHNIGTIKVSLVNLILSPLKHNMFIQIHINIRKRNSVF
jgi:hypothetical protein